MNEIIILKMKQSLNQNSHWPLIHLQICSGFVILVINHLSPFSSSNPLPDLNFQSQNRRPVLFWDELLNLIHKLKLSTSSNSTALVKQNDVSRIFTKHAIESVSSCIASAVLCVIPLSCSSRFFSQTLHPKQPH